MHVAYAFRTNAREKKRRGRQRTRVDRRPILGHPATRVRRRAQLDHRWLARGIRQIGLHFVPVHFLSVCFLIFPRLSIGDLLFVDAAAIDGSYEIMN